MTRENDLFKDLTNDAIKNQELTVDKSSFTRLMYLDDVEKGTVVRFSRCRPLTPDEMAAKEKEDFNPISLLKSAMIGHQDHVEEDVDVTVLDRRDQGGVVSLILVDEKGEQFPYLDMCIKTIKAVVQ